MFQEYMIARAMHAEKEAEFNSAKLVEGMTVEVLNLFDRALLALREMLMRHISRHLAQRQAEPRPAPAR